MPLQSRPFGPCFSHSDSPGQSANAIMRPVHVFGCPVTDRPCGKISALGLGSTISASLARLPKPYQLPMMLSNMPGGVPCNGAASGAARGRPCVLSSIAQAADTRAASLVPPVPLVTRALGLAETGPWQESFAILAPPAMTGRPAFGMDRLPFNSR